MGWGWDGDLNVLAGVWGWDESGWRRDRSDQFQMPCPRLPLTTRPPAGICARNGHRAWQHGIVRLRCARPIVSTRDRLPAEMRHLCKWPHVASIRRARVAKHPQREHADLVQGGARLPSPLPFPFPPTTEPSQPSTSQRPWAWPPPSECRLPRHLSRAAAATATTTLDPTPVSRYEAVSEA